MTISAPKSVKRRMLKVAFEELVDLVGGQIPAEANCRASQSSIQRWGSTTPDNEERFPPLDVVRDLEAIAGDAVVTKMMASMAGLTVVTLPSVARPADLFTALSDLSREASELTAAICAGFNDGKFCDLDAAKARSECDDVIERAAQMRALLNTIVGENA